MDDTTLRLHTAQANETIVVTAIDIALLTSAASSVVNDRLDHDAVTRFNVLDVVAHFFYRTAEFMSDGQGDHFLGDWMRCGWHDACSAKVFMKI